MKKFVLRHWRGNGEVIADVMRDKYFDYPKHRNKPPITLATCIVQVISQEQYLEEMVKIGGVELHNKQVKKLHLGDWNLIKEEEKMKLIEQLEGITLEQANEKINFATVELDDDGNILMYSKQNKEWFAPNMDESEVLGKNYFTEIAPCTNNFLFQGRFQRMVQSGTVHRSQPFDYVFTYKIRPTKINVVLARTKENRNFVVIRLKER